MNHQKIYNLIIQKRLTTPAVGNIEKHHIIPKSLGGSDSQGNLVSLTYREHFICHVLLVHIHKNNKPHYFKMVNAAYLMSCSKNNTSRKYEKLKLQFSKVMSINQLGSKNSQYGNVWIYNELLKVSKKVHKNELNDHIINGWLKGRKIIFTEKEQPICKKCGSVQCEQPDICSKHQMVKTLIKVFGLDPKTLGTDNFYSEYNRVVESIKHLYLTEKMSTLEIAKYYNISTQRLDGIFKSLGIKHRNLKEAMKNYVDKTNISK